jgi:peptidoglycan hydrolase-like protein with peptidoglycan-binding domain
MGDAINYPGFRSTVDMDRIHVQKQGDGGDSVKWIQRRLPNLIVDGLYGPKTADAVKTFQAFHKISVDGICGLDTTQLLAWVKPRTA